MMRERGDDDHCNVMITTTAMCLVVHIHAKRIPIHV